MTIYSRIAAVLLSLLLLASPAYSQETIFDPENPDAQAPAPDEETSDEEEDPTDEETGERRDEDSSSEETIFDPQNPAVSEDEIPGRPPDASPAATDISAGDDAVETAEFLGEFGSQLAVDSAFDEPTEDIVELSTFFDLRLSYEPSRELRFVVEGQFRHWVAGKSHRDETNVLLNATRIRADYDARPGDAYVVYRTGAWSTSFGNQVVRWGSTDLVRPGDVINPVDLSSIQGSEALERLPQLILDVSYIGDGWTLTGLLVPFFKANRQWAFGRDTALLSPTNPVAAEQFPVSLVLDRFIDDSIVDDIQPLVTATRLPDEVPENLSVGARATATVLNTDFGLGYFFGWDRTPFIFLDSELQELLRLAVEDGQVLQDFDLVGFFGRNPQVLDLSNRIAAKRSEGEEIFFSEYRRMHTLLVDGARFIGPIGIRADVAFQPEKTYYDRQFQGVRRPTLSSALGLSYERLIDRYDQLLVTVEGFYVHPFSASSDVTEAFVASEERGGPSELLLVKDGQYGLAAAATWGIPWIESRLQLGGLTNFNTGDAILSASFSHRFETWLRTSLGLTVFEGPDPAEEFSLGGVYDHNDFVSLTVDGAF